MDEQTIVGRIDIGDSGVMPLEMEVGWRDCALKVL
jgi:hypothetical protein